jgi:hypothetical protein
LIDCGEVSNWKQAVPWKTGLYEDRRTANGRYGTPTENGYRMTTQRTNMHFGIDPRTREIVVGSFRLKLPQSRWLRVLIGLLLVVCGILGFLPILGFWMVPLGLLVLSHDSHFVRRQRRRFAVWWASRKARRRDR